jgi:hypothetical protein
MMRRRPLLRAAAVGGGAYMMGKRSAQRQETAAGQQSQDQQSQPADQGSVSDQLDRLAALRQQGALTDAEFAAAKSRLLGT